MLTFVVDHCVVILKINIDPKPDMTYFVVVAIEINNGYDGGAGN